MTVSRDGDRIVLSGECHVEEAETLVGLMSDAGVVDWSECRQAHSAVIQVLLTFRPKMVGRPLDPFLAAWIAPALAAAD
jgi:hypothetical protein